MPESSIVMNVYQLHYCAIEGDMNEVYMYRYYYAESKRQLAIKLSQLQADWIEDCIESLQAGYYHPPTDLVELFEKALKLVVIERLDYQVLNDASG